MKLEYIPVAAYGLGLKHMCWPHWPAKRRPRTGHRRRINPGTY